MEKINEMLRAENLRMQVHCDKLKQDVKELFYAKKKLKQVFAELLRNHTEDYNERRDWIQKAGLLDDWE